MVDRRQFLQASALAAGMAALPGVHARTQGGGRVVSTWDFGVPACSGVRYIRGELRDILPEDPGRRLTMAD